MAAAQQPAPAAASRQAAARRGARRRPRRDSACCPALARPSLKRALLAADRAGCRHQACSKRPAAPASRGARRQAPASACAAPSARPGRANRRSRWTRRASWASRTPRCCPTCSRCGQAADVWRFGGAAAPPPPPLLTWLAARPRRHRGACVCARVRVCSEALGGARPAARQRGGARGRREALLGGRRRTHTQTDRRARVRAAGRPPAPAQSVPVSTSGTNAA